MTLQNDSDGFQQVKSKRGPGPRGLRKQGASVPQRREGQPERRQNEQNQNRRKNSEAQDETPRERLSFKDLLFERNNLKKHEHSPKVDLFEEKDEKGDYYVIKMEIPGVNKNDITITVRDKQFVLVSAFKKEDKPTPLSVIYSECKYGKIMRRVKVPHLIYEDQVYSTYEDGILKIELVQIPKVEEQELGLDSRLDDEQTEIETITTQVLYSTLVDKKEPKEPKDPKNQSEPKTIDFKNLPTGSWADDPIDEPGKSWADM